jgi:PAS domain S-box-containing protein
MRSTKATGSKNSPAIIDANTLITGYKKIAVIVNLLVLGIVSFVIVGWILDVSFLKNIFPNSISMKFNTALCFAILSCSSLVQLTFKNNAVKISNILFFTVFAYGIISYSQEIFSYDAQIDQFFVTDFEAIAANQSYPGRMSPVTAICFCLMAVALFRTKPNGKKHQQAAQFLLHIVTLLSFIAIVGYLFSVPALYNLSFHTSMAVLTAFVFFIISISTSLLNSSIGITGLFTGTNIGNVMARKLFLQITIAILFMGFTCLLAYRYAIVNVEFGIALYAVSFIVVSLLLIWKTSNELNNIDLKRTIAENSLSRVERFLDSTPDPIVIVGDQGVIQLVNRQTLNVFGYTKEELIGQKIETLLPERFREKHGNHRAGFFDAPKIREMGSGLDLYAIRKNGQEIAVEVSLSPIKTETAVWVSAAIRDITERKKDEEKVNQLAAIIKSSDDGIISKTLSGVITTWNKGAEKIFGYTSTEVIGKHILILFPPELREEEEILIKNLFDRGYVEQFETTRIKKD